MRRVPKLCLLALVGLASAWLACPAWAQSGYMPPTGGWTYIYDGDVADSGSGAAGAFDALDGTWSHDNGSDQWDGSGIGDGNAGGVATVDGYLRIQDPGDPRDHGMADPGSTRKVYLGHDISAEGASTTILDDGVTFSFRARIATGGALDDLHPDGGGAIEPWPATGDGYVLHDGGKGPFGIKQADGGLVSFGLANAVEDATGFTGGGLIMNNLNGNAVSGDVDWQGDEGGTQNVLALDPTAWHEFWITIEAGGTGTHLVNVYSDGSSFADTFEVTAGTGSDFSGISYIAIGAGSTPQHGAIDIDFVAWAPGVIAPGPQAALGDFNGDGSINEMDFFILSDNLAAQLDGTIVTHDQGDIDRDRDVDLDDFDQFERLFPGVVAAALRVPEPSAAVLALIVVAGMSQRGRRRPPVSKRPCGAA